MKKSKTSLLPPSYLLIFLLFAIGLHFVLPIAHIVPFPYNLVGLLLIAIGIWLNLWADGLFKTNETTVKPFEKSSALILDGPFRFTRHPMYLGMVIGLLGLAILLRSLVTFFVTIAFAITMTVVFIHPEEKAMKEAFGNEYLDYKARVRRWV
jgi:protein-S-isoprenylcysteine O-methyltransferase Ste14